MSALLAAWHWVSPAAAQGPREWALSLGPQLGYGWVGEWVKGTLERPGQFTRVDPDGEFTGMTLGTSAALTKRFWWDGNRTAWGPIVAFSYAYASDTQATIPATDPREQAIADGVAGKLHPRFMRYVLQGGAGLTLLGGLFESRFLLGGEICSTIGSVRAASNNLGNHSQAPTFNRSRAAQTARCPKRHALAPRRPSPARREGRRCGPRSHPARCGGAAIAGSDDRMR